MYGAAQRSPESQGSTRILEQEPHILKLKRVPRLKLEIPEPNALVK